MTEEVKMTMPEGTEKGEPANDSEEAESPQFNESETEAMKLGWKPEADFQPKNGRKWKTAERFLEDKPLYDKIDEQHKHSRKLERQVELLRAHYEKVEKTSYDRALADLRTERKQALEEGDLVRAEEIRDAIDEKKQAAPRPSVPAPDPELSGQMEVWRERNDWYEKDEDMTAFADGIGNKLLKKGVGAREILETVEEKVRITFKDKFRNPNRDAAPRVEGGSGKKGKSSSESSLSADETRIMENLIKSGAPITREEYIKDILKNKGQR